MVQAIQYSGKVNEDASAHLQDFMEIGNTIAIERVNQDHTTSPLSILNSGKSKAVVLCQQRRHQHMGEVFQGLSSKILPNRQDKCLKRKDYQLPTTEHKNHFRSMGVFARIHLRLSSSWNRILVTHTRLLSWIEPEDV